MISGSSYFSLASVHETSVLPPPESRHVRFWLFCQRRVRVTAVNRRWLYVETSHSAKPILRLSSVIGEHFLIRQVFAGF